MNIKKILLWIGIVCLLLAGYFFYSYYRIFHRQSDLPACIPSEAESVVYLNSKIVYKNFLAGKDSVVQTKALKSFPYFESIKDIKETGIDFISDAAFVQYKDIYYGLMILDDEGEFAKTVDHMQKGLFGPVQKDGDFRKVVSLRDSFVLAWNRNLMVIIFKRRKLVTDQYIKEILNVEPGRSFSKNKNWGLARKDDALAWFYSRNVNTKISAKPLKGYLNFDSSLLVFATDHIDAAYPLKHAEFYPVPMNTIYADTGSSAANLVLTALSFAYIKSQALDVYGAELYKYVKVFRMYGEKEIRNEVITYEFDENFNKKQVTTIKLDTVNAASLYLSTYDGKKIKVFANHTDTLAGSGVTVPGHIRFRAFFNQDLPSFVYPVPMRYEMQLQQEIHNGHQDFWVLLKPGEWDELLGL